MVAICASGTLRPLGRGQHQVAQGLELGALLGNRAGDDVDEIGGVAQLRDGGAGQHGIDVVGELLGADAERARPVLVDLDADRLARLVPVVVDVARVGVPADHLREGLGQLARLSASGPLTRNFSGQPTGGPSSSGLTRASTLSKFAQRLAPGAACTLGALLEALGDDHGLGEEVVGELRIERQVEADRTLADIEAPVLDVGIGLEQLLDAVDDALRGLAARRFAAASDRPAARAGRRREELLLHEAHANEREQEQRGGCRQHRFPCGAAPDRGCGGTSARSRTRRACRAFRACRGRMNTPVSGVNSTATIQETIKRDADHGKQREAVFAGTALREADRHEAGDRDQRAGQHRERRSRCRRRSRP